MSKTAERLLRGISIMLASLLMLAFISTYIVARVLFALTTPAETQVEAEQQLTTPVFLSDEELEGPKVN